jgi:hypothetical protein
MCISCASCASAAHHDDHGAAISEEPLLGHDPLSHDFDGIVTVTIPSSSCYQLSHSINSLSHDFDGIVTVTIPSRYDNAIDSTVQQ